VAEMEEESDVEIIEIKKGVASEFFKKENDIKVNKETMKK